MLFLNKNRFTIEFDVYFEENTKSQFIIIKICLGIVIIQE